MEGLLPSTDAQSDRHRLFGAWARAEGQRDLGAGRRRGAARRRCSRHLVWRWPVDRGSLALRPYPQPASRFSRAAPVDALAEALPGRAVVLSPGTAPSPGSWRLAAGASVRSGSRVADASKDSGNRIAQVGLQGRDAAGPALVQPARFRAGARTVLPGCRGTRGRRRHAGMVCDSAPGGHPGLSTAGGSADGARGLAGARIGAGILCRPGCGRLLRRRQQAPGVAGPGGGCTASRRRGGPCVGGPVGPRGVPSLRVDGSRRVGAAGAVAAESSTSASREVVPGGRCLRARALEEPFGIVFLEAMASGLPLAGHTWPVTQWVIGDAGESLDMTRPGSLSGALARWQAAPGERQALAARARNRAAEQFAPERLVPRYLDLYAAMESSTAIAPGGSRG
jgi:hypothetical protein